MPTYLLHGFRWPRPLVRIHIILQNLDDAAAEWLMAPLTTKAMLGNFNQLYPQMMEHLSDLRFIEQYDPVDESADSKSQPYVYVADVVHEVKLGVEIDDVRGKGVTNEAWGSMVELRDKIAPGEKVAWYVVVCGDTERWAPPTMTLLEGSNGNWSRGGSNSSDSMAAAATVSLDSISAQKKSSRFRKLFGGGDGKSLRKSKSTKTLAGRTSSPTSMRPPSLPSGHRISSRDGSTYTSNEAQSPLSRMAFQTPPRTAVQSPPRTAVQPPPRTAVQSPPYTANQPPPNDFALQLPPNGTRTQSDGIDLVQKRPYLPVQPIPNDRPVSYNSNGALYNPNGVHNPNAPPNPKGVRSADVAGQRSQKS